MTTGRLLTLWICCAWCGLALIANASAQVQAPGVLPPPSAGPSLQAPSPSPPPAAVIMPDAAALPEALAAPVGPYDSLLPEIVDPQAAEALPPGGLDGVMAATIAPAAEWYHPSYWWGPEPWDAGIEVGINGSEGNNSVFSMRTGGHVKRVTPRWKLDSSLVYNKNEADGVQTQNNGKQDLRLDRILAETPWTLFVLENFIYDEFQTYDMQLSLNTGIGYQWIKTPATDFLTRLGFGSLRQYGGSEDDWQPTALAGLDFTRQLTKMQRITAKIDYYPEWEDFRNFRVISDFGWEIQLDQPKNMSLKLSAIDRYNSSPDGSALNNLDYALLLIWGL